MQLDKKTYERYAFQGYSNKSCFSRKEFMDDLKKAQYAKKLVKKLANGQEINIRLLLNHIILFTNVFEIDIAKELLMFNCSETEKSIMKSVLLFLGFTRKDEYGGIPYHAKTVELLRAEKI